MKACFIIIILLLAGHAVPAQDNGKKAHKRQAESGYADPYKGKPFKANDTRTLVLSIPIGKLTICCTISYTLLDDPDGMAYGFGHRYKAQINEATFTGAGNLPQQLKDGFTDRVIELTAAEIMYKTISTKNMFYWFTVQDFNLDGKPDFAFIGDLGYHSNPVNNYVWVNINNRLVYWDALSDKPSFTYNSAKRIIGIQSTIDNVLKTEYYTVVKDTLLLPVVIKE